MKCSILFNLQKGLKSLPRSRGRRLVEFLIACIFVTYTVKLFIEVLDLKKISGTSEVPYQPYVTHTEQLFWQKVNNTNDDMYVYSAYHDVLFGKVRIIAVAVREQSHNVTCIFLSENFTSNYSAPGMVQMILEHHDFYYGAAFVHCPLSEFQMLNGVLPSFVSIVAKSDLDVASISSNILRIQYPSPTPSVKFAVCVSPTYSYDKTIQFLEWIEFQRSLGVERFTFYNTSIGPTVSCVINEYRKVGVQIEVLPWGDPSENVTSGETIKLQNQLAAANDCIYRHRGVAEYVISIDLDELIIPHNGEDKSYEDLIRRFESLSSDETYSNTSACIFEIKNVFFSPDYNVTRRHDEIGNRTTTQVLNDTDIQQLTDLKDSIASDLVSLRDIVRMKKPHPYGYRSKFICNPRGIVEIGIHYAYDIVRGCRAVLVPIRMALIHHYRPYETPNETVFVKDLSAKNLSLKYGISSQVYNAFQTFRDVCSIEYVS